MKNEDMPRKSVIARVARVHGTSKTDAEKLLRNVLNAIAGELADRRRFHIAEIGSISVEPRPPRRYFNPRSRERATSRGDTVLKINISKAMRRRLDP